MAKMGRAKWLSAQLQVMCYYSSLLTAELSEPLLIDYNFL
jgi:hypothetical protein